MELSNFEGLMMVPENIRNVQRPPNTVVVNTGNVGPKQFPVRERNGGTVINGRYHPHNGRVIGHIYNGEFIPKDNERKILSTEPDFKSYGPAALVRSVIDDLLKDLMKVFDIKTAQSILCIAALRVISPNVSCRYISTEYKSSYLSSYYPGIGLSSTIMTNLLKGLGGDLRKRDEFFQLRLQRVCETHHIAIDGSLIQDTSEINDLSGYSHKARVKGCADISILYAYDIELHEPICAHVFPGCEIDASSYQSFIVNNKIEKGIIVADKGFPPSKIKDILKEHKTLHYITPIKLNDSRIVRYDLLSFEGVLQGIPRNVRYKKFKVSDNEFLYAFQDVSRACGEFVKETEKAKLLDNYNDDWFKAKERIFGTIVFEADRDLPPIVVYNNYDDRWLLELVFRAYKSNLLQDCTKVQSDYAVLGSEFINFISTVITCRIIKKFSQCGFFENESYREIMRDLDRVWRRSDNYDPLQKELPKENDGNWIHTYPKVMRKMISLGLVASDDIDSNMNQVKDTEAEDSKAKENTCSESKTTRPVGRPRIHPLPDPNQEKKPRGRPRIHPLPDPDAPKRKPGRPRIHPISNEPKRPRGRPKGSTNKSKQN